MKILSSLQIKKADEYTIAHEPISSIDLMERAAKVFVDWFIQKIPKERPIHVICGPGNNGGDGLAVARLLDEKFYSVKVHLFLFTADMSEDFNANFERLRQRTNISCTNILDADDLPQFPKDTVIIDSILGSGINRPAKGLVGEVIDLINQQELTVCSIDLPSGIFADRHTDGTAIKADYTLSFQLPKFAFMFPENGPYIGEWTVAPIGLHPDFLNKTDSFFYYVTKDFVRPLLKKRGKFDHKGTYGHALLAVGSRGKMGAGVLATRACLRAGAGLVTAHIPRLGNGIMQISVPEAMLSFDLNEKIISTLPNMTSFSTIGMGCGIGTANETTTAIYKVLTMYQKPVVLDADALNIIGKNKSWLKQIPPKSILTPHPKEFERLFGKTNNDFERNEVQADKARELDCYIILKGAHTCIATPEGNSYYNSTGNPGMATAGSGDVLTGILTGLLSQGYSSFDAAVLGVYLHGLAGDLAADKLGQQALLASDIIENLGKAFMVIALEI